MPNDVAVCQGTTLAYCHEAGALVLKMHGVCGDCYMRHLNTRAKKTKQRYPNFATKPVERKGRRGRVPLERKHVEQWREGESIARSNVTELPIPYASRR